jgi:hypothetical protein
MTRLKLITLVTGFCVLVAASFACMAQGEEYVYGGYPDGGYPSSPSTGQFGFNDGARGQSFGQQEFGTLGNFSAPGAVSNQNAFGAQNQFSDPGAIGGRLGEGAHGSVAEHGGGGHGGGGHR